jgi:hypothetical protein
MAREAGYKKIEDFLEESLIDPDYGWDMLEAKRRFYAEVGKNSVVRLLKNVKEGNNTRKRSGSNSNNSKSKSKSKSNNTKSNSKSKTPRGGAGGED